MDVGVPHLIVPADDTIFRMEHFVEEARALRFHEALGPEGANVNFAAAMEPGVLAMRTYERGIEDEVLSCSSGSWAALCALIKAGIGLQSPLRILNAAATPLIFDFETAQGEPTHLRLTGEARLVFLGRIQREAWDWSG